MSRPFPRVLSALAVLLLLALATWRLWPASAAATTTKPTSVGTVSFATINGTTVTEPLLSFTTSATAPTSTGTGGAGAGKFTAGSVQLAFSSGGHAPLVLRALAAGTHVAKTTITLYAAGTSRAAERWTLTDSAITSLAVADSTIGKPAKVSIAVSYSRLQWATLTASGATYSSTCWDLTTNAAC